jgi:hypothetical protein
MRLTANTPVPWMGDERTSYSGLVADAMDLPDVVMLRSGRNIPEIGGEMQTAAIE